MKKHASFLKTEEPDTLPWTDSGALNEAFADEMRLRGGRAEFVPVNVSDYFGWLGKFSLADSPANRAQFISWLTSPKPKPAPSAP